jgi:hypothetical protein
MENGALFPVAGGSARRPPSKKKETRAPELARRLKNIVSFIGQNYEDYCLYNEVVPEHERSPTHPQPPDMTLICSRNIWDENIRNWKKEFYGWIERNKKNVLGGVSACTCILPPLTPFSEWPTFHSWSEACAFERIDWAKEVFMQEVNCPLCHK